MSQYYDLIMIIESESSCVRAIDGNVPTVWYFGFHFILLVLKSDFSTHKNPKQTGHMIESLQSLHWIITSSPCPHCFCIMSISSSPPVNSASKPSHVPYFTLIIQLTMPSNMWLYRIISCSHPSVLYFRRPLNSGVADVMIQI
jgi:hypothetical protein